MTNITLPRATVQRALDALTLIQTDVEWELNSPTRKACRKAELEMRAALEQPQAEPWRPIESASKDGTPVLAWYQKFRLDDDDDPTDEVIGGACAIVSINGREWDEPEWLSAHGAYFMEDWCFAETPTHWQPLPAPPGAAATADHTNELEALLRDAREALLTGTHWLDRDATQVIAKIDVALGGKP